MQWRPSAIVILRTVVLQATVLLPTTFLSVLFLLVVSTASGQTRDLRAERLVLDDNNSNTISLQTPTPPNVPMSGNYTIILPEPSTPTTSFLFTDPPIGTTTQNINGSVSVGQDVIATSIETASMTAPSGSNLRLSSTGSVVIGIDEDNNGTGSSFAIESNALATPDLLRVTETGLTDITSSSATGGLRVTNTNGSGTARILELQNGTTTQFHVQRNGNATVEGDVTVNGTGHSEFSGSIAVGGFLVLDSDDQTALNAAATLTPNGSHVRVGGNGGNITLNGTTGIANGSRVGQILLLIGSSDANSVTLNDGANVQLAGGANRTLGLNDALTLIWNGTDWIETSFADN